MVDRMLRKICISPLGMYRELFEREREEMLSFCVKKLKKL